MHTLQFVINLMECNQWKQEYFIFNKSREIFFVVTFHYSNLKLLLNRQ
jgi:hypothetical protein